MTRKHDVLVAASVLAILAACGGARAATATPLAKRIVAYDESKAVRPNPIHLGAGGMLIGTLIGNNVLSTNLTFFQQGVLPAKSSIGEHFHYTTEEMFIILDGDAEFTVNGRTSVIKAPAMVPVRLGSSHAVYNPTDKPMTWMNVSVGQIKGVSSAFDLNDPRVGVPLDKIPQFVSARFDKTLLHPVTALDGGQGTVMYRRVFDPSIFATPWSYVDHMVIPSGASIGPNALNDMTEIYYVLSGDGKVSVGGETSAISKGQAIAFGLGEQKSFAGGSAPLEMMVIGIARDMDAKTALMRTYKRTMTLSAIGDEKPSSPPPQK